MEMRLAKTHVLSYRSLVLRRPGRQARGLDACFLLFGPAGRTTRILENEASVPPLPAVEEHPKVQKGGSRARTAE